MDINNDEDVVDDIEFIVRRCRQSSAFSELLMPQSVFVATTAMNVRHFYQAAKVWLTTFAPRSMFMVHADIVHDIGRTQTNSWLTAFRMRFSLASHQCSLFTVQYSVRGKFIALTNRHVNVSQTISSLPILSSFHHTHTAQHSTFDDVREVSVPAFISLLIRGGIWCFEALKFDVVPWDDKLENWVVDFCVAHISVDCRHAHTVANSKSSIVNAKRKCIANDDYSVCNKWFSYVRWVASRKFHNK